MTKVYGVPNVADPTPRSDRWWWSTARQPPQLLQWQTLFKVVLSGLMHMSGSRMNRSNYCIWQGKRPIGTEEMLSMHLSKCVCLCLFVWCIVCTCMNAFEDSCLYVCAYISKGVCVWRVTKKDIQCWSLEYT